MKKFIVVAVIVVVVLGLIGSIYQWRQSAADLARFPAPGQYVEVDGLLLHLDCRGSGSPTVIFESGLTSGSFSWARVHDAIANVTRACAYDRPGMDWSEPLNREADATEVATRLHRLLEATDIAGPKILVGMSAGGVYVREYFRLFPADIQGMVLVDSSHEQQGSRLPDQGGSSTFENVLTLCAWLQPIGVIRALGLLEAQMAQFDVPLDLWDQTLALNNQSHVCASMLAESLSFQAEVYDPQPPAALGDLPLTVLSQGKAPEGNEAFGITEEMAAEMAVVWDELQTELTGLSSRGQRIIAYQSGHVIQLDQPDLVISAITSMVEQLQTQPLEQLTTRPAPGERPGDPHQSR